MAGTIIYRAENAYLSHRGEGVVMTGATGTGGDTTRTCQMNQVYQDFGTCSAGVGTSGANSLFTCSTADWYTDRLIGGTVHAWNAAAKATYYGSGTIDDNTSTTLTVTTADFDSSPGGVSAYWEIDLFAIAGIQAAQTGDLGLTFNAGITLPEPEVDWILDHAIGSGSRDPRYKTQGKFTSKGTLSGRLRVPRLVFYAMGKDVITNATTAPYTHTITGTKKLPSFIMECLFDEAQDMIRYYRGCKVNSLKITSGTDEPLMCEAEIFCAIPERTSNTKSTLSLDANATGYKPAEPYMFYQAPTAGLTYLSTTYAKIKSFELTINNNLSEDYHINATNAKYPDAFYENKREIEFKATVIPTDDNLWDELMTPTNTLATGATTQKISIVFTKVASTDTFTITLNSCNLVSAPHNPPESGPVEVEITAVPHYDGTNEALTFSVVDNNICYML